jgi:hypothetical protein
MGTGTTLRQGNPICRDDQAGHPQLNKRARFARDRIFPARALLARGRCRNSLGGLQRNLLKHVQ